MGMPDVVETWTREDVLALPDDGNRVPILAVEVLSPSTARYDRALKRKLYQRVGVAEYWIVDLDARLVERWRPEDERPEIVTDRLIWVPAGAPEPLAVGLDEYFREVMGSQSVVSHSAT